MREIGNMANGCVTRGLLGLRPSAVLTGNIQIPNRKSGIRIRPKPPEIITIQISNRKYSPLLRSLMANHGFWSRVSVASRTF